MCVTEIENEVGEREKALWSALSSPFKFKSSYDNQNEPSCRLKRPRGEINYHCEKHDKFSGKVAALQIRNDTTLKDFSILANVLCY